MKLLGPIYHVQLDKFLALNKQSNENFKSSLDNNILFNLVVVFWEFIKLGSCKPSYEDLFGFVLSIERIPTLGSLLIFYIYNWLNGPIVLVVVL